MLGLRLDGYEPDLHHDAAVAFCIQAREDELFSPLHQHRKGQLILALHGAITCEVENAMWMVPPQYAVWIPGEIPHSNHVTVGAQLCFLFIEPQAVVMPERCCTENRPVMSGTHSGAGVQIGCSATGTGNSAADASVV